MAIDEHWFGLEVKHDFGRRSECHGRNYDFIPFFNADGIKGEMQSRRSGIDCDGMPGSGIAREILFELS